MNYIHRSVKNQTIPGMNHQSNAAQNTTFATFRMGPL